MERAAWTSERLDDLATAMREGFARVDNDIRDVRGEIGALRGEMNDGFKQLRGEIGTQRVELTGQVDALRQTIDALHQTMIRVGGGMLIGFISVLAAILARGA